MKHYKRGFTLIELIVVIAILAVLALILLPSISHFVSQSRNARNDVNARSLYSEVNSALSIGTAIPTSPVVEGGVSCEFAHANGILLSFACTALSNEGLVSVTFSP